MQRDREWYLHRYRDMSADDIDTAKYYLPPIRPIDIYAHYWHVPRRITELTGERMRRLLDTKRVSPGALLPDEVFSGHDWPIWALEVLFATEGEVRNGAVFDYR